MSRHRSPRQLVSDARFRLVETVLPQLVGQVLVGHHRDTIMRLGARYNLCRAHESLSPSARNQATPAMALGITDRVWALGDLIDAALAVATPDPTETAPDRRRKFRVIQGGVS
jgi:hypothetical protein